MRHCAVLVVIILFFVRHGCSLSNFLSSCNPLAIPKSHLSLVILAVGEERNKRRRIYLCFFVSKLFFSAAPLGKSWYIEINNRRIIEMVRALKSNDASKMVHARIIVAKFVAKRWRSYQSAFFKEVRKAWVCIKNHAFRQLSCLLNHFLVYCCL